jgi:hypothetical protein
MRWMQRPSVMRLPLLPSNVLCPWLSALQRGESGMHARRPRRDAMRLDRQWMQMQA